MLLLGAEERGEVGNVKDSASNIPSWPLLHYTGCQLAGRFEGVTAAAPQLRVLGTMVMHIIYNNLLRGLFVYFYLCCITHHT